MASESGAVTIYALCDDSGMVQYIGQTRHLQQRRWAHHRSNPGLTLIVVTHCDEEDADEVEREWIERYRAAGCRLRNAPGYRRGGGARPRTSKEHPLEGEPVRYTLRVPPDLYAQLGAISDEHERSLHAEMIRALREHLKRERRGLRAPRPAREAS